MSEAEAIKALKSLAKNWPRSLWLFTNGQALYVMKKDENGKRRMSQGGGFDPSAEVASVEIDCEGGDW